VAARPPGQHAGAPFSSTPRTASPPGWSANERRASASPIATCRRGTGVSNEYDKARAPDSLKWNCL
jgi:hypothetical protein